MGLSFSSSITVFEDLMNNRKRGFPKRFRCGEPVVMKTSTTAKNPVKLFHACPFRRDGGKCDISIIG